MLLDEARYEDALHLARAAHAGLIQAGSSQKRAVRAVQDRLSALGFATESDGIFGTETQKQLEKFQKSRGAKVDGVVGPETLGKLIRSHKPKANAADTGMDSVSAVVAAGLPQTTNVGRGLGAARAAMHGGGTAATPGGTGASPSAASLHSRARARRGQSKSAVATPVGPHGGAIDPVTGAERATSKSGPIGSTDPAHPSAQGQALNKAPQNQAQPSNQPFEQQHPRGSGPQGGQFVSKGDSGQATTSVQRNLNRTGIQPRVKVDGEFGDNTEHAVREFQTSKGLTADGIVGPQTTAALRQSVRTKK